jgi:hypothetical protein
LDGEDVACVVCCDKLASWRLPKGAKLLAAFKALIENPVTMLVVPRLA